MATQQFPLGSYGQSIRATITENGSAVNISSATSLKIRFRTPDGQTIEKTATFVTDGSDGVMGYTVESGLFDIGNRKLIGVWEYQPSLVLGTFTGPSCDVGQFQVIGTLSRS